MQINNSHSDHIRECLEHMKAHGFSFDGRLEADGELHRFSKDSKKNQPDEWYICHEGVSQKGNSYLICTYGTWSGDQEKYTYRSYDTSRSLSHEELQQLREQEKERNKQIEARLKEDQKGRIMKAQEKWDRAIEAPAIPSQTLYLDRKQVHPYGIKYGVEYEGCSVVFIPLRNIEGELQAVQCIQEGGTKRIYGVKKGNFHVIGKIEDNDTVYVAEGYATAASVHMATKHPSVIAFDCGNLKPVIHNLRIKYPNVKFVIVADNDSETPGNPGKTKAEEAAKAYGCNVVLPMFPEDFKLPGGKRPTDFNDLHVHYGLDEVLKQLTSKKNYLRTLTITDLLSLDIPPRKLILSPWLPEKGLAMICAARGIGKTFLSLFIAYAVSCGSSVLSWKAAEPRKVLYIDGEMPAIALQERLTSISKSFHQKPPHPSYFKVVPQELQASGIKDLATITGQCDVNELLEDADLVILDNLSTLIRSGNENEAESWLSVQEWALSLRKQGKSLLFIHHAGKNGTQRGTSKREDILDSILMLKRPQNYAQSDGARFEVHYEKARGFYGDDAEPFEATLQIEQDGILSWRCSKVEGYDLQMVVSLYNQGITNQREIAKEADMSLGKVNKLIKKAKGEGLI